MIDGEPHVLLDLDDEGEDALDPPEAPRHAVAATSRRAACRGCSRTRRSTERNAARIDETRIDHPSSLPARDRSRRLARTAASQQSSSLDARGREDLPRDAAHRREHVGVSRSPSGSSRPASSSSAGADSPRASSPSRRRADDPPIWATAQYLSYAPLGATVTVTTDLAVVGGHVTQARSTATVEDREILTVNAALGDGELTSPDAVGDDARRRPIPRTAPRASCPSASTTRSSTTSRRESRSAGRSTSSTARPGSPVSALWSRVPGPPRALGGHAGDLRRLRLGRGHPAPRTQHHGSQPRQHDPHRHARADRVGALRDPHARARRRIRPGHRVPLESRRATLLATASQSIAAKLWDLEPSRGFARSGVDWYPCGAIAQSVRARH